MNEHRLRKKLFRGLAREKSLGKVLRKVSGLLREVAVAQVELRSCDKIGSGARVFGRLRVENRGRIEIGRGFIVKATYCTVELISEKGGAIEIGESVFLNFGTVLHARQLVRIGDRSQIGQYSILTDSEAPEAQAFFQEEPKPIVIGKDVWIAGRVTVLPGSTIGDGSVITAGSIVSGDIPPGVLAGGVPARVLRTIGAPSTSADEATPRANEPTSSDPAPPSAPAVESRPAIRAPLPPYTTGPQLMQELVRGDEFPDAEASAAALTLSPKRERDERDRAWLARQCTGLGEGAWLAGRPAVTNEGKLTIGSRFRCASTPVVSHFVTGQQGVLEIGDDVSISYGAAIYCEIRVRIGDGTRIGPYFVVSDTSFHVVGDLLARPEPRPVEIGRDVKIGARVSILPGVTIGDGATVVAGSTVRGAVAAGAVVSGVPAKVQRPPARAVEELRALVARTLGLLRLPAPEDGAEQIADWDSSGLSRLLLAIEAELGLRISQDEMELVKSVADLAAAVDRARAMQAAR